VVLPKLILFVNHVIRRFVMASSAFPLAQLLLIVVPELNWLSNSVVQLEESDV